MIRLFPSCILYARVSSCVEVVLNGTTSSLVHARMDDYSHFRSALAVGVANMECPWPFPVHSLECIHWLMVLG